MALHFNFTKIANKDSVCFIKATEDSPMDGIKKGDDIISPATSAMIWMTMFVGIGQLTEKTAPEFYARMVMSDKLNDIPAKQRLSWEDVQRHIGLSTNVTYETAAKWAKRCVLARLTDDAKRYTKLVQEKAEGAVNA